MYAIKRELKLNNKERTYLAQCAGYSRFVYNFGLAMVKASWTDPEIKGSDSKRVAAIKKLFTNDIKRSEEFQWTNNYSSRIYQNAFADLQKALSNWRNPKLKARMPQFKRKRHNCSFTVDSSNGKVLVKAGKKIKIPTLGTYRLKEAIPYNCVSQTFTISREGKKWYVSFAVPCSRIPEMKHTKRQVGIDLGIKVFATLSDGNTLVTPESLKKAKTKLRELQWRNRNKVLGNRKRGIKPSNNALKYYEKLRDKHQRIVNIREDFLQKKTTELATTYQHILIEDLNVKGMMANHKLSEALGNLGLYRFRELLTYKQQSCGHLLTVIDRWKGVKWTFMCLVKDRKGKEKPLELYNIAKTPIVRHVKVVGTNSPDDPSLKEYWVKRAKDRGKKYWAKGSKYERIAKEQNWKCPACGETLFNGEAIETHHIVPVRDGGSDDKENLIHLHKACHKQVHGKSKSARLEV